jgi:mannose/fructose/N-acetylgalactosamine-specific phosphotransferase system component IID
MGLEAKKYFNTNRRHSSNMIGFNLAKEEKQKEGSSVDEGWTPEGTAEEEQWTDEDF